MAAWIVTALLLVYAAGVPMGLALIGSVTGAVVIHRYVHSLPEGPLSRGEMILRIGAYVLVATLAVCFVLLLAVTMLAFLVAWLVS